MSTVTTILEDERDIEAIHYDTDDIIGAHRVGKHGVTSIKAYGEPGLHGYMPWIAVYVNGQIKWRVPATKVEIEYRNKD